MILWLAIDLHIQIGNRLLALGISLSKRFPYVHLNALVAKVSPYIG